MNHTIRTAVRALALTFVATLCAHAQQDSGPGFVTDILGVRLGMSLNDARQAVKAHSLGNYKEYPLELYYRPNPALPAQNTVPGGRFTNEIETDNGPEWKATDSGRGLTYIDKAGGKLEYIDVLFSPEPLHEKVVRIEHEVQYDVKKGKGIREVDLLDGFAKKYGVTFSPDMLQQINGGGYYSVWTLTPPGHPSRAKELCTKPILYFNVDPVRWSKYGFPPSNNAVFDSEDLLPVRAQTCGREVIGIYWQVVDQNVPADQRIVAGYGVKSYAPLLQLEAAKVAQELTSAARTNANQQAATKAAAQDKPPF